MDQPGSHHRRRPVRQRELSFDTRTIGARGIGALVVYDRGGNPTECPTDYRIDNTPPVVDYYHSIPATVPPGVSTLTAGPEDFLSGIGRIEWWIDGAFRGAGWQFNYNFGARQRSATVELRVADGSGNVGRKSFRILVDKSGPKVVWKAPGHPVRGKSLTTTIAGPHRATRRGRRHGQGQAVGERPQRHRPGRAPDQRQGRGPWHR